MKSNLRPINSIIKLKPNMNIIQRKRRRIKNNKMYSSGTRRGLKKNKDYRKSAAK